MNKYFFYVGLLLFVAVLFFSCAQVGSLTGGLKDSIPPRMLKSMPKYKSANFDKDKITLTFDEYVQFKDIDQQFIVSPVVSKKPEYTIKQKSVVVKFKSPLKDSTTYTLDFGNSVVDNNEGNALKNFQFVFSTGSVVDSFSLKGNILDAFTALPPKDVVIQLYEKFDTLTPIKEQPSYVSKSDTSGNFSINNIRKANYHIFALKDVNSNYKYDQPNEQIAFIDSVYTPSMQLKISVDTLKKGIVFHNVNKNNKLDTLRNDSIIKSQIMNYFPNHIRLFLFQEDNAKQYITKYIRDRKGKCLFVFNRPPLDSVDVSIISPQNNGKVLLKERTQRTDSVYFWISDSTVYNRADVVFKIKYFDKDSLGKKQTKLDTIKLNYTEPENQTGGGLFRKKVVVKKPLMKISSNLNQLQDLDKTIWIETENPVNVPDMKRIKLFNLYDTIVPDGAKKDAKKKVTKKVPVNFKLVQDSICLRKYNIDFKMKPEKSYLLRIDTMMFTDIFDNISDSVVMNFTAQKTEFYGTMQLIIKNIGFLENFYYKKMLNQTNAPAEPQIKTGKAILQLLDEKGTLLKEFPIKKDGKITISYLTPAKYKLRIIHDRNDNNKWDTGDYLKNRQPETVILFKTTLTIRSNWDNEATWDLSK